MAISRAQRTKPTLLVIVAAILTAIIVAACIPQSRPRTRAPTPTVQSSAHTPTSSVGSVPDVTLAGAPVPTPTATVTPLEHPIQQVLRVLTMSIQPVENRQDVLHLQWTFGLDVVHGKRLVICTSKHMPEVHLGSPATSWLSTGTNRLDSTSTHPINYSSHNLFYLGS